MLIGSVFTFIINPQQRHEMAKLIKQEEAQQLAEVQAEMNVTTPDIEPWRQATAEVYKEFDDVDGFAQLYESIRDAAESP